MSGFPFCGWGDESSRSQGKNITGGADPDAKAKVEEKQGVPTTLGENTETTLSPTPDDHIIPGTTVVLVRPLVLKSATSEGRQHVNGGTPVSQLLGREHPCHSAGSARPQSLDHAWTKCWLMAPHTWSARTAFQGACKLYRCL